MSYEEKNTWVFAAIAPIGYITYLVVLFTQGDPFDETSYIWPMVGTILGAIVAGILGGIAVGVTSPKEAGKSDLRDKQIGRFGDHVGQGFVIAGALAAMLMAIADWDRFWIANVIYLGFVLSAVLSSVAKIVAYRRGFQPW